MIQLFGLIFLIILISLIYLSYNGRIPTNIPLIFMFFILVIIPFTYLETSKPNIESYSNYSNYDQIMNSSLDIYYTNQRKKMPTDNDMLKKVKFIENPVQTKLISKQIDPITIYTYSYDYWPWSYIGINDGTSTRSLISTYTRGLFIKEITLDDLVNKTYDRSPTQELDDVNDLKSSITDAPDNTYLIIIGNNINGLVQLNADLRKLFIDTYKFNWLNSFSYYSTGCFITILYKENNNVYTLLQEKYGTNVGLFATQNFMTDITYAEQDGEIFTEESSNESLIQSSNNPLLKSKYNIISPVNTKSFSALSFTSENNKSFVYLSSRNIEDKYTLYNKSPSTPNGPVSNTILDTQQPQYWVFEPISKYDSSPLIVFIRTYTKPYYYLDVSNNKIEMSMFKGSLNQHWEISGSSDDNYKIKHSKTELYIGYSNFGGYLYEDNGSILLTESNLYDWKISSNNEILPDIYESFAPMSITNKFEGIESPTDFNTALNPSFKISKKINDQEIVIESKGRTVWEPNYAKVWNGKWIYYGTVASYQATQNINTTDFLIIKMNNIGTGTLEDQYLNFKINLINAGSNILTGVINSGKFNGYRAILKIIPSDLVYSDPFKSYPVKMRYFVVKNKKELNLSSGNIYNMQSYSTKFDGDKLILANFLEASGIQVDVDKAFSKENLVKINNEIVLESGKYEIFNKISKWIGQPITSKTLLYKASVDGWSFEKFHQLCDFKGATVTIATITDGRIIGGYSPWSWGSMNGQYINDTSVFLFDNDNKYTTERSPWGNGMYVVYQNQSYFPAFGGGNDFYIPPYSPQTLYNNPYTFSYNGMAPLNNNYYPNVTQAVYNLKDLEVYAINFFG